MNNLITSKKINIFCFLFLLLSLAGFKIKADQVTQVKGQRALVEFDQTTTTPGEEFYTLDKEGNRKGLIKITQVKGKKALSEILKGKPEAGQTLTPKIAPSKQPPSTAAKPTRRTQKKIEENDDALIVPISEGASSWGGFGNVYMNSMSAKVVVAGPREVAVNLQGTSFGLGGFYDYRWSPDFALRGIGALDQYQLAGSTPLNDCENTTSCTVSINYLSSYGIARYDFTQDRTRFWAGGGFGYLFALSKSSSILDTSQISTSLVYVGSVGADIQMSGKSFIPVQFDYVIFQGSGSVRSSSMVLRAGYGFYF